MAQQFDGAIPGAATAFDDLAGRRETDLHVVGPGQSVTAGGQGRGKCPPVVDPAGHGDRLIGELPAATFRAGKRQRDGKPGQR